MDLETLRSELRKLTDLVGGWNAPDAITELERDLVLEKLRTLYEAVRFAGREPSAAPVAEFAQEVSVPAEFDLTAAFALDPLPAVETDIAESVAAAFRPAAVEPAESRELRPGVCAEAHAEPEAILPEPNPAIGAEKAAGGPGATDLEVPEAVLVSEQDPVMRTPLQGSETGPEAPESELSGPEPEEMLPAFVEISLSETGRSDLTFDPESHTPAVSSEPTATVVPTPASEPAPTPEPEPEPEFAPEPEPASKREPESVSEPKSASQPVFPTLFGPEEEPGRHRHKQRLIMSLYGAEPTEPAARTAGPAGRTASAASGSAPAVPEPDAAPEPFSEPPQAASETPERTAGAASADSDTGSAAESESAARPEPRVPGTVLGEVINHDLQTLADTLAGPQATAADLAAEPVTDLRRAIGINDKFLLIRDLFGGDGAAYEAAIEMLNGFGDFDECMIHIAENYAWNPRSDGAKFLMNLLERKFA